MDQLTEMLSTALERLNAETAEGLAVLSRRLDRLERSESRLRSSPASNAASTESEQLWDGWADGYRQHLERQFAESLKTNPKADQPLALQSCEADTRPACRGCGSAGLLAIRGDLTIYCKAMSATMRPLECPGACTMRV